MAANDRIFVSQQNRQEQAALDDLRPYFRPWRCTFVDQRDDFGRDGFVQVVDQGEDGKCSMSPISFGIQCKSSAAPLRDSHPDSVETRHLQLWTGEGSSPLILVLWSAATREFRFRSVRSMRTEIERTNPTWGDQKDVSVVYRKQDGYVTSDEARAALSRLIRDEVDARGGVERFHSARRRIVLTNLFKDRMTSSQTIELKEGYSGLVHLGEAWQREDLDFYELSAQHALSASLLLFEEVWIPLHTIGVCMDLLGENVVIDLLERRRIILQDLYANVGLLVDQGSIAGKLVRFEHHDPKPIEHFIQSALGPRSSPTLVRTLKPHVSKVREAISPTHIFQNTLEDLNRPNLRAMLGLKERNNGEEPVWDAGLVNRLVSLNLARTLGSYLRADAVQYEGGLSRLASEKEYGQLGIDRRFKTSHAFDAALRVAGSPDLGQLVNHIPINDLVALSDTPQAQDFRDWFWSSAASLLGSGADLTSTYIQQVQSLVNQNMNVSRFPMKLKFRYFESVGGPYIFGPVPQAGNPAFASTAMDGDATIRRQRLNFAKRRKTEIKKLVGVPSAYTPCPCKSGDKFRFCCGREIS